MGLEDPPGHPFHCWFCLKVVQKVTKRSKRPKRAKTAKAPLSSLFVTLRHFWTRPDSDFLDDLRRFMGLLGQEKTLLRHPARGGTPGYSARGKSAREPLLSLSSRIAKRAKRRVLSLLSETAKKTRGNSGVLAQECQESEVIPGYSCSEHRIREQSFAQNDER